MDSEVEIRPGKLGDFRAVATDLIAATGSETGTLSYEYNLSPDEKTCHIFERYADPDAIMVHLASFGAFAPRFIEACHPIRFDIYGAPSEAVQAALADFNPVYFTSLGGFNR